MDKLYESHALAMRYREMTDDEYGMLKKSIEDLGLLHPIVLYEGKVLDGVHRQKACSDVRVKPRYEIYDGSNPQVYLKGQNEARRHLTEAERVVMVSEMVEVKHGGERDGAGRKPKIGKIKSPIGDLKKKDNPVTIRQVSKLLNVSERSVSRINKAKRVLGTDKVRELAKAGESVNAIEQKANKEKKKQDAEDRRKKREVEAQERVSEIIEVEKLPFELHCCSVMDLYKCVENGSIDVVLTDPPYEKQGVADGLWGALSDFALHALKPMGMLVAMSGAGYVDQILMDMRREGLAFRCLAVIQNLSPQGRLRQENVFTTHKFLHIYTRSDDVLKHPERSIRSSFDAPKWEKGGVGKAQEDHEWGQAQALMDKIVEMYLEDGLRVCDPFVGAGSSGISVLGRKGYFIGADIDVNYVEITRQKLIIASTEGDR